MYDFSTAGPQQNFEIIADGTVAVVALKIRHGNAGEDGILKRSKKGDCEGLDLELTIVGGQFDKRKLWAFMIMSGTSDGHTQAADISGKKIKAILESARGVKPADVSEAAIKARQIESLSDLDGIRFLARIGVEPARDGYKAKNILDFVITPDCKEWQPVEQVAQPVRPAVATEQPSNVIVRPAWAQ
jgi:hypothetical protein